MVFFVKLRPASVGRFYFPPAVGGKALRLDSELLLRYNIFAKLRAFFTLKQ
jgi:hypothetical protein